jgi:hypothetical protein
VKDLLLDIDLSALDPSMRPGVEERVAALRSALGRVRNALASGDAGITAACSDLVGCWHSTGSAWRRYMSDSSDATHARLRIDAALAAAAAPLIDELAQALARRPATRVRTSLAGYAIACAACGKDAATFERIAETDGVRVGRLSPIFSTRDYHGPGATGLLALLAAGNARALLEALPALAPACDAYCVPCGRVYCADHCAVETVWSGTWHESTSATCPLRHEREID